jgi:hypothetical protein
MRKSASNSKGTPVQKQTVPVASVHTCNACRTVIDLDAAKFFGFPTFQCDKCCSTKSGNPKRIYCSDQCKENDMRDFHFTRCGRQSLLRKPVRKGVAGAALTVKCQGGHGGMLSDHTPEVVWLPGFVYSNISPKADLVSKERMELERRPIDMELAIIQAHALRDKFLDEGECLCGGEYRPIRECHKFSIVWPHLPVGQQTFSFDKCCPELVAGLLSAYAGHVVVQRTVQPTLCTVHDIAVSCLEAAIQLYLLGKDYWEVTDKYIRLADEFRNNGFIEQEFSCYEKLIACAREEPSRRCRMFMWLNALIGEVRNMLDPIDEWRLDLRSEAAFDVRREETRLSDKELIRLEDLAITATGYIMILEAKDITHCITGGAEKLLDLHATVLHFMARILFQRLLNAAARGDSQIALAKIDSELQSASNEMVALVKNKPGLYYYYGCCVVVMSCVARERMGVAHHGTSVMLHKMTKCSQRNWKDVQTLDRRRRADLKVEEMKASQELNYRKDKYQNDVGRECECLECLNKSKRSKSGGGGGGGGNVE